MKKTNIKSNKGITLVALIITIVVLLILAMVAIGAVQESNIIGHAENAAGSFNQAKANESLFLTQYEETLEELTAEKIVVKSTFSSATITIFPVKGIAKYEEAGETVNGTVTVEELTQELLESGAVAEDFPTSINDYAYAMRLVLEGLDPAIMLVTKNKEVCIEGHKWDVVTYTVTDTTLESIVNKS